MSTNSQGQKTPVDQLFYTLKPGEIKHLPQLRPLGLQGSPECPALG
ncbi:MAG: hypothetical protein HOO93_06340 [Methyloglobulus sp.]|nr:hypothetical protein [Methyloglobulus sp.]